MLILKFRDSPGRSSRRYRCLVQRSDLLMSCVFSPEDLGAQLSRLCRKKHEIPRSGLVHQVRLMEHGPVEAVVCEAHRLLYHSA